MELRKNVIFENESEEHNVVKECLDNTLQWNSYLMDDDEEESDWEDEAEWEEEGDEVVEKGLKACNGGWTGKTFRGGCRSLNKKGKCGRIASAFLVIGKN